jgi:hypothetical protein
VGVPDATNALTLARSPFLEASKISASKEIWSKNKKNQYIYASTKDIANTARMHPSQ